MRFTIVETPLPWKLLLLTVLFSDSEEGGGVGWGGVA